MNQMKKIKYFDKLKKMKSDSEGLLTNILSDLKTYVESNSIEPHNKTNKFRNENIRTLKIYEEITDSHEPLEMLYDFFTPSNIFEILDDIKLGKKSIDCFTARTVYNLIEKTYIRSWISGIKNRHPRNYKIMALGAYTIRAVMRVVIRELITTRSGEHGVVDDIIDTIGDCKSENAYRRDSSVYQGTCTINSNKYSQNSNNFLNEYSPARDNCPDIHRLLSKNKITMETDASDPRWLNIVQGSVSTSKIHNVAADVFGMAIRASDTVRKFVGLRVPDNQTSPEHVKKLDSYGKSKGRKIVSKVLKKYKRSAISGGRKTIKRKHRKHRASKKYIK